MQKSIKGGAPNPARIYVAESRFFVDLLDIISKGYGNSKDALVNQCVARSRLFATLYALNVYKSSSSDYAASLLRRTFKQIVGELIEGMPKYKNEETVQNVTDTLTTILLLDYSIIEGAMDRVVFFLVFNYSNSIDFFLGLF